MVASSTVDFAAAKFSNPLFFFKKQLQLLKKGGNKYFISRKVSGIDNSKIQTISCKINQKGSRNGC